MRLTIDLRAASEEGSPLLEADVILREGNGAEILGPATASVAFPREESRSLVFLVRLIKDITPGDIVFLPVTVVSNGEAGTTHVPLRAAPESALLTGAGWLSAVLTVGVAVGYAGQRISQYRMRAKAVAE